MDLLRTVSYRLSDITVNLVLHNEPKVEITHIHLVNWTLQLATGIAFIHEKDFIHHNLKPSK